MVRYKMLMCILSVYITYPSLFWIFAVHWLFSHKHSIHDYNGNSCWVKIRNTSRCCKKNGNKSSELSILLFSFNIFDNKPSREILIHIHVDSSPHTHQAWWMILRSKHEQGTGQSSRRLSGLPFQLSLASHQQINFWIDRSWVHLGAKKQRTVSLPFSPL